MSMTGDITLNVDFLRQVRKEIDNLDEAISSASGGDTAGKRSIIKSILEAQDTSKASAAKEAFDAFWNTSFSFDEKAALFFGLMESLEAYEEELNGEIKKRIEAAPKAEKKPLEEIQKLVDRRKELTATFRTVKQLLELYGFDLSGITDPKKMTGSRGPRGPRALSEFQYAIDGKELSAKENTLSWIASSVGMKSKDFRDYLRSKVALPDDEEGKPVKFDTKNPPEKWSVELPNGKTLSAEKFDSSAAADDDDDDDDEAGDPEE